jgi:GNAT superfamily N-acetyltransferase
MQKTIKRAILTDSIAFLWENQARQYPRYGSGITYFKGECEDNTWVDCLLYYGYDNELHGILNHYPFDMPPYQKAGSVNIQVRPDRRRKGIATALLDEAIGRFQVDIGKQEYTPEGERFIKKYVRSSTKYKLSRPRNSSSLRHIVK